MLHFYPLTIKDIRRETADTVSVAFAIPESLKEVFTYKAGQYLTLKATINGLDERRSYSLCSAPHEDEWRIAVKRTPYGVFSTYVNEQLRPGDTVEVMPPLGKFTVSTDVLNRKKYVAFAAGSGITPVISIIKTILHNEPQSSVTLIYGNRTSYSIIFKNVIEDLKNMYMDRFRTIHVLSREITDANINSGRIDAEKCNDLFTRYAEVTADEFFICGPEAMISCVKDFLLSKGVEEQKIRFELFTTPDQKTFIAKAEKAADTSVGTSKVTIKMDGRSFSFELGYNDQSILDAALQTGADLPYSCKGGVCCSCRAKVLEGEVEMDVNYALEEDEVKEGFVLTCQSHPRTEEVVIDFDAK